MQWIEATLAFAITMLILSMMVTALVEALHRALALREAGLRWMLRRFFDKVVWPQIGPELVRAAAAAGRPQVAGALRDEFLDVIAGNRVAEGETPLQRVLRGRKLDCVSTLEFMQRFGGSAFGLALLEEVRRRGLAAADTVLKGLAQSFEAFSADASAYFGRRARLFSVAIALLLAFAVNVDAVLLFRTYLTEPELRRTLIEQSEAVRAAYDEQAKALAALQSAGQVGPDEAGRQVEAIREKLEAVEARAAGLRESGVPIGWDRFPGGGEAVAPGRLAGWFFSVLLAGLLVGLGGPFWYDVIKALSALANLTRGLARPSEGAPATPAAGADPAAQPTLPVEVFRVAAEAFAARLPLRDEAAATGERN